MAVTIAKPASAAVAMAVISPERSTDMGEAYAVPQVCAEDQAASRRAAAGVGFSWFSWPVRASVLNGLQSAHSGFPRGP